MARASQRKNLVVRSLLVLGFWTLIGLSFAGQFFIASSQLGRPVSWQTALQHSLADWYVIAILSVLPLRLSARFRLDGPDWWPRFLLHLVASGCFSVLFVLIRSLVALWQPDVGMMNGGGVPVMAKTLLVKTWHFNLLIYWVILSVGHALAFYRSVQERETRTADLERRLAEARLQALQMQLNPSLPVQHAPRHLRTHASGRGRGGPDDCTIKRAVAACARVIRSTSGAPPRGSGVSATLPGH